MTVVTEYVLGDVRRGECGGLGCCRLTCCRQHCHVMSQQPSSQPLDTQAPEEAHQDAYSTTTHKPPLQVQSSCSPCSSNPASPTRECPHPSLGPKSRRSLKNEDSSYDSDFDSSEVVGGGAGPWRDEQHEDVCRTVSDTLAAEFAEYVTIQPNTSTTVATTITKTVVTTEDGGGAATAAPVTAVPVSVATSAAASLQDGADSAAPVTAVSTADVTAVSTNVAVSTTVVSPIDVTAVSTSTAAPMTAVTTSADVPVSTTAVTVVTNIAASVSAATTAAALPSNTSHAVTSVVGNGSSSVGFSQPALATAPSVSTVTVTSIVSAVSSSIITASSTASTLSAVTKTPLVSALSLPSRSHGLLPSRTLTPVSAPCRPGGPVSPAAPRPSSAPVTRLSSVPSATDASIALYQSKKEFAIKLGYSKGLVQLALEKLGGNPTKDELLNELIRLGAGAPRSDSEQEPSLLPTTTGEGEEGKDVDPSQLLRPIIIDGSNVALSHGDKNVFSCRGLRVCVDWFLSRGHRDVIVFVPTWRKEQPRPDALITDQEVLVELEQQKVLVFTPSRTGHTSGRRIVPYDDRYILNEAVRSGGVVVSNDNFRDLAAESAAFRRVVEEALLMYSWVNGRFVPPDDPLGRNGPTLDAFLRRPLPNAPCGGLQPRDLRPCPYGRKCTYGNKCKYQHPERGTQPVKSVTEQLQEKYEKHKSRDSSPGESLLSTFSLPLGSSAPDTGSTGKKPLSRTHSSHAAAPAALSLPPALLRETPTRDASAPRPTTPAAVANSPVHGPALQPCSMQLHPMLLPPYASHEQQQQQRQHKQGFDTYGNPMFTGEGYSYPLFTTHQHFKQQQHPQLQSTHQQLPLQQHHAGVPPHVQQMQQQSNFQQQQSLNWNYSQQQMQERKFPEHLLVRKQMSDPDSVLGDNTHPKLRRQLTLNPANDHRLTKMTKLAMHQKSLPLVGQGGQLQTQSAQYQQLQQYHLHSQQQDYAGGLHAPLPSGFPSSYQSQDPMHHQAPPHQQAALSHDIGKPEQQQQQQQLPPDLFQETSYSHPHVTRFSSAPDPIWGGGSGSRATQCQSHQGPPAITRLNSTSDPHLNLYGNTASSLHYMSEQYSQHQQQQCQSAFFSSHPTSGSPRPVGSRPMSPLQQSMLQQQHHIAQASLPLTNPSFPTPKTASDKEEERSKMYYHLLSLFSGDEDVVLATLAKHPNETDARKILASILDSTGSGLGGGALASAGSQQHQPLMSCQNVPPPLRVPSPTNPTAYPNQQLIASATVFPSSGNVPHEDSRLRDYLNPQPILPVQQASTSGQQHSLYLPNPHDAT